MLFRLNPTRLVGSIVMMVLASNLAACSWKDGQEVRIPYGDEGEEKLILTGNLRLMGAGASFPAPLYQHWFIDFKKIHPQVEINYQSIGSEAGIQQFVAGAVDFGATNVAMTDEDIAQWDEKVLWLPMAGGSIALAYNLPGMETQLNLPRDVYIDIFLGKIQNWNHPKLAKANPDVLLPDKPITVIYQSPKSDTTQLFTQHLSAISDEWKTTVAKKPTLELLQGAFIRAGGNGDTSSKIQQTEGAIGYVDYSYATLEGLNVAALENRAGNFVMPTQESVSRTLAAIELPESLRVSIPDPSGSQSYPLVTYSWMLAYNDYFNADKAKTIEAMIEYGLTEGQKVSAKLGYVPLPDKVIEKVVAVADEISRDYKIDVSQSQ